MSVRLMCVDDNEWVAEAIQRSIRTTPGYDWAGWLPCADELIEAADRLRPDVVLLDIDMPGRSSFEALRELAETRPGVRVAMLSGHIRLEYITRAFEEGAWGYLAKTQPAAELLTAVGRIAAGEVVMSPEVEAVLGRA